MERTQPLNDFQFKIYYSNGTTYVGDIANAPIWEVVLILEKDSEHGRKIVSGGDYFVYDYESGKFISGDFVTMLQYMARPGDKKRFLVGVMLDNKTWNKIMKQAREDIDFPIQTATHIYEDKAGF